VVILYQFLLQIVSFPITLGNFSLLFQMAELLCVDMLMFSAANKLTATEATSFQLLGPGRNSPEVQKKYANVKCKTAYLSCILPRIPSLPPGE
jgi:hypothetical protein